MSVHRPLPVYPASSAARPVRPVRRPIRRLLAALITLSALNGGACFLHEPDADPVTQAPELQAAYPSTADRHPA